MAQETRPTAAKIALSSPLNLEVFQRQTFTQGEILIAGKITGNFAGRLVFHFTGKPMQGDLPAGWEEIAMDPSSHTFNQEVPTPSGGWYRLDIQEQSPDGVTEASVSVAQVGVGEVFVISGQSNSTNYGQFPQKITTGMVSNFDGHHWVLANDPQPGVQDRSKNGSFIPAFGDALVKKYHVPIGIAATGAGARACGNGCRGEKRSIYAPATMRSCKKIGPNEYESTGELFDGLVARIKALGPHGFARCCGTKGSRTRINNPNR